MKRCSKCNERKALEDFPKDKRGRWGRSGDCRKCRSEYRKEYDKRPEVKKRIKKYKDDNPELRKKDREARVLATYGEDGLKAEKRRTAKNAKCDSCGGKVLLRIDHCHESNEVRGVLCHNCNVTLGLVADDPERLRKLADYLEKWMEDPSWM